MASWSDPMRVVEDGMMVKLEEPSKPTLGGVIWFREGEYYAHLPNKPLGKFDSLEAAKLTVEEAALTPTPGDKP